MTTPRTPLAHASEENAPVRHEGEKTRPALSSEKPRSLRAARGSLPSGDLQAGAAALGRWAEAHRLDLEVIAQRRDADGPMVDRALEIVRRFIIERELILFGGLAIDYALRLKGSRIYPDDERPDFDFLSPRSVDDAYDLADLLQRAGFEGVGAIRGIHVQTMKVRTNFIWVADIGYAPRDVFDRIPTLEYGGMRIVHPDFQRMDMHLAFCFPFNGPPLEDVFHRWRKDLKRFNLFATHYPVRAADGPARAAGAGQVVTARAGAPVAGRAQDLSVALHGFAAYSVLRSSLDELAAALKAQAAPVDAPRLSLAFPDDKTFAVETPAGGEAYLASPEPAAAVEGIPGVQPRWYDPYMDVNPELVKAGPLVVLSTRGRLLAATIVSVAVAGAKKQAYVVTPQYLLLHFLFEAHRADGPAREVYRAYYAHTLEILRAAEDIYADALDREGDEAARQALMDTFAASPFAPTVRTVGTVNNSAAYVIKMATNAEKLRDTPPPVLNLDPGIADLLVGLPQNYYPETARQRPAFDYERNALFRRSGLPRSGPQGGASVDGLSPKES